MADREDIDDQDQSETFDETHLDDEGDGDVSLEEMDDVLDVTQLDGDADENEDDSGDFDVSDDAQLDDDDIRADALPEREAISDDDGFEESDDRSASDEIELVYTGLMRNVKGAQASAAHWEARRLDDDDIDALGYAPEDETDRQEIR